MAMTDKQKEYLADTSAILMDYDGMGDSIMGLRGLIDEARERIEAVLGGDEAIDAREADLEKLYQEAQVRVEARIEERKE